MSGRRVHERYPYQVDVVVVLGSEELRAVTDNLSMGGMHLVGEPHPPFGAEVELRFRLPKMKADTVCAGTVRWSRPDGYGVQFGSLRAIDVWGLNALLKTLTPITE